MFGLIWLDRDARTVIEQESKRRWLRETGGPLFGYEAKNGEVVIVQAYGPGLKAKHMLRGYRPDRQHTQRLIDATHQETNGVVGYLGDWHTHPRGTAAPSGRDQAAAMSIASQPETGLARPVVLIQATKIHGRSVQIDVMAGYRWNTRELRLMLGEIREWHTRPGV